VSAADRFARGRDPFGEPAIVEADLAEPHQFAE
jgi:hypothetical protein